MNNLIFIYFAYIYFLFFYIFINYQGKCRKMLINFNIHCYSYQVKNTILSYERYACFDSAKRAKYVDQFGVRTLVTGACKNTQAHFSLLPISNRKIVCGSYFGVYGATC